MSTVASRSYTVSDDMQWVHMDGNRFLTSASGPLGPRNINPGFAPFVADVNTGIAEEIKPANMLLITCSPNPTQSEVALQFYLYQPSKVTVSVYDIDGKLVKQESEPQAQAGLYSSKVNLGELKVGIYFIAISDGANVYTKKIVKD